MSVNYAEGQMPGPGGMQGATAEPAMFAPVATGPGGNSCLVNNDEDDILDGVIAKALPRTGDLSNEDDSHVMGIYKTTDFAGS